MNPVQFVSWLKNHRLFEEVSANYRHFEKVLTECLNVKREQLMILTDLGYEGRRVPAVMAGCYLLAAKRLGLDARLAVQPPKFTKDVADD